MSKYARPRAWDLAPVAPVAATKAAPAPMQKRMFAGAQFNRLTSDWIAQSTSIDSEVVTSLRTLRNRSRQLVRDNDYVANAMRIIKNNVIGSGISFQAQVVMQRGGKLDQATNDAIETQWKRWSKADSCSANGKHSFEDLERLIIGAIAESGEVLIRIVKQKFGNSKIPFALEIIESDQIVENLTTGRTDNANQIKMGVEMDKWGRVVAYHMYPYHPGDLNFAGQPQANRIIRVPAEEVIHLGITSRPGQTRYTPWVATGMRSANDMDGYEEAEIVKARASANIMAAIQTPENDVLASSTDDGLDTGNLQSNMAPGVILNLKPGETFTGFSPSSPNPAMEPFIRYLLRKLACGIGVSYESISRDYSQTSFSSGRLSRQDDIDNWRALQSWLISKFHQVVYERWLEAAVYSQQLNLPMYDKMPEKYQCVQWKPRGWSYVDPLKDAMADKMAIRMGTKTLTDVIAAQGGDIEETFKTRRRELDMAADYKLVLESDPSQVDNKGASQKTDPLAETDQGIPAVDGTGEKLLRQYQALEVNVQAGNDENAINAFEQIQEIEQAAE